MIIGTFEVAISLLGLILLVLAGKPNVYALSLFLLLAIYGAMGAGLWAIQEWARSTNVILHIVAVPYTLITTLLLGGQSITHGVIQIVISAGIVIALTRPEIRHKFQTVVPKKRHKH